MTDSLNLTRLINRAKSTGHKLEAPHWKSLRKYHQWREQRAKHSGYEQDIYKSIQRKLRISVSFMHKMRVIIRQGTLYHVACDPCSKF